MAKSMWISLSRRLKGVVLLVLMPIAASQAGASTPGSADETGGPDPGGSHAAAGGAFASEVPQSELIDNKDGTALAADNDEGSIPVAQELDFILGNGFRKRGAYDDSLRTVARVEYYGTPERAKVEEDVVLNFCHYVHFFRSAEVAQRWLSQHPGTRVLTLEQAWMLGREKNVAQYGEILAIAGHGKRSEQSLRSEEEAG